MSLEQAQLVAVAKKAVVAAAAVHRRYFDDAGLQVTTKADQTFNQVTQADVEAEQVIVDCIRAAFPDHNIVAEEDKYTQHTSPYTWIVDPLDGTNNFAAGIPMFSVSVAVAIDAEVVVGVVYDVMRDEMFWAQRDGGAFLNDKVIHVNAARALKEAILITGFYYDRGAAMRTNLDKIQQFFEQEVIGIRRFGSAALDLCYVACGRAGGFWEFQLHPWDFAAGMLIVQEAGGCVTNLQGEALPLFQDSYVVSSNKHIHQHMLTTLQ